MDGSKKTKLVGPEVFLRQRKLKQKKESSFPPDSQIRIPSEISLKSSKSDASNKFEEELGYKKTDKISLVKSPEPTSPLPKYPSLQRFSRSIESVLRGDRVHSHSFSTAQDDEDEEKTREHPRKLLKYTRGAFSLYFVLFGAIVRILSLPVYVFAIFISLPLVIPSGCRSAEDFLAEQICDDGFLVKLSYGIPLSLTIAVLFFGMLNFLPRTREIAGFNSLKDRTSIIVYILSGFHEKEWLHPVFDIFFSLILLDSTKFLPKFAKISFLLGASVATYYLSVATISFLFDIFGMHKVDSPDFATRGTSTMTSITDIKEKEEAKKGLPSLVKILYGYNLAVIIYCYVVIFLDEFEIYNLGKIIILSIIALILALNFWKKGAIFKKETIRILRFFVFYIQIHATAFSTFNHIINAALELIFIILFLGSFVIDFQLDRKKQIKAKEKENEETPTVKDVEAEAKKQKILIYPHIVTASLLFVVAFYRALYKLYDSDFFTNIVTNEVSWCVSGLSERVKNMFYDFNLSENEVIIKVFLLVLAYPFFIALFVFFYYISAERRARFEHKSIPFYATTFIVVVLVSYIFSSLFLKISENDWSWSGIADSVRFEIVTADENRKVFDVVFAALFVLSGTYSIADFDENEIAPDETEDEKIIHVSKPAALRGFVSLMMIIFLFALVISKGILTPPYITLRPANLSDQPVGEPLLLESGKCNAEMVTLARDQAEDLLSHMNVLESYKNDSPEVFLLDDTLSVALFLLPASAVHLTTLFTIVMSHFWVKAREVSLKLNIICLAASFACFFPSVFIYPTLYVMSFAFTYPFYDVVLSTSGRYAILFNIATLPIVVINLLENYIHFYAIKRPEENAVDKGEVEKDLDNVIFY